ncbi:MAG: hypothetical protein HQK60_12460 [Deltaproteobacteria bacterium]|nr:hypothetical protein [Deltaproteobacteria bacterium]
MPEALFKQAKALADKGRWDACRSILKAGLESMPAEDRERIFECDYETLRRWFVLMTKAKIDESYATDPSPIQDFFGAVRKKVTEGGHNGY